MLEGNVQGDVYKTYFMPLLDSFTRADLFTIRQSLLEWISAKILVVALELNRMDIFLR